MYRLRDTNDLADPNSINNTHKIFEDILVSINTVEDIKQRYNIHRVAEPQPKEFSHEGTKSTKKNIIKTKKLVVDISHCNILNTNVL